MSPATSPRGKIMCHSDRPSLTCTRSPGGSDPREFSGYRRDLGLGIGQAVEGAGHPLLAVLRDGKSCMFFFEGVVAGLSPAPSVKTACPACSLPTVDLDRVIAGSPRARPHSGDPVRLRADSCLRLPECGGIDLEFLRCHREPLPPVPDRGDTAPVSRPRGARSCVVHVRSDNQVNNRTPTTLADHSNQVGYRLPE